MSMNLTLDLLDRDSAVTRGPRFTSWYAWLIHGCHLIRQRLMAVHSKSSFLLTIISPADKGKQSIYMTLIASSVLEIQRMIYHKIINPFTLRDALGSIVCYSHTLENNLGIKRKFTKSLKVSCCLSSD